MAILFAQLTKRNEIIIHNDDNLAQAKSKSQSYERLPNLHGAVRNLKLKTVPEKTFLFSLLVCFLVILLPKNKVKPLLEKIETIQQMERPESKKTS